MFQAQVFTLYPEVFPGPLAKGLYGKALSNKLWNLMVINIRDTAADKHKTVDDTPYGGGTGMLLNADILANSLDRKVKKGERVFYLSPKGKKERIQYFEGVCIAKKNRDLNSSFTVRKISFGEGVERTFPLYGTLIDSIKVIRSG